jgi:hypothetical protein
VLKAIPTQPTQHDGREVTTKHRGNGLAKQLLQSVSAHLSGYAKIHAIARSWAIHVIHLIVKPLENAIVAPCQQRKQPNYTCTHAL